MVVVSQNFNDCDDTFGDELGVAGRSKGRVGIVSIGSELKGKSGHFHIVVDVIDDNPKPIEVRFVAN